MTPFASPPMPAAEDVAETAIPKEAEAGVDIHDEYEGVAPEDFSFQCRCPS